MIYTPTKTNYTKVLFYIFGENIKFHDEKIERVRAYGEYSTTIKNMSKCELVYFWRDIIVNKNFTYDVSKGSLISFVVGYINTIIIRQLYNSQPDLKEYVENKIKEFNGDF